MERMFLSSVNEQWTSHHPSIEGLQQFGHRTAVVHPRINPKIVRIGT
jgi:hypothetical protein